MSDIDERYPAYREKNMDDVVLRLVCDVCSASTEITRAEELRLLSQMNTKYPAQVAVVECKCGEFQHVLKAR